MKTITGGGADPTPNAPAQLSETPHFLSLAEAARTARVSRSTLYRAVRAGAITAYATGNGTVRPRRVVRADELAAWTQPRPAPATRRGFTLVELLVVVVIIGILAGIAIPVFMNQKAKAYDASVKSDLKSAALAVETLSADADAGSALTPADWAAEAPASPGNQLRVFTTDTGDYVAYGQHSTTGPVWAASSWSGGTPCRTTLTELPEVAAASPACPGVPSGVLPGAWNQLGGAAWSSTGPVVPDIEPFFDPTLETTVKTGVSVGSGGTAAYGYTDSAAGTSSSWSQVFSDAPVSTRAAQIVVGDATAMPGIVFYPTLQTGSPPPSWGLVAGQVYTASAWVKVPAGAQVSIAGRFFTGAWGYVGSSSYRTWTGTGDWQRISQSFTASASVAGPGNFAGVQVRVAAGQIPVGGTFQAVAPQVERGGLTTPFQRQVAS